MSGLHFAKMDAHYPLPDISDLDLVRANDEQVLYEIIRRKGLPIKHDHWYRPVHGIHASPNRSPEPKVDANGRVVRPGWGIPGYIKAWTELASQPDFQAFREVLSSRIEGILSAIDQISVNVLSKSANRSR